MEEIFKALVALGPGGVIAAIMAYLWREERVERRELGGKVMQITADAIEAEKDMTAAMQALSVKLKAIP